MRIKVYPGPVHMADILDRDGYAVIEEGATVGELLKALDCPKVVALLGLYTVNHGQAKAGARLKDGDVVSIIAFPGGG